MIAMLLVVGSLVPASDSVELTTAPPQPGAVGVSVHVRDQIQLGMTVGEVQHLLGKPSGGLWGIRPGGAAERLRDTYDRVGLYIWYKDKKVWRVTRFQPEK
jgi:hypothetical protein